jgi:uncharacterized protein
MRLNKKLIASIETEAKKYFAGASGCHDWTHVERVRRMALHLSRAEGGDKLVIEAAALLHDTQKGEEMRRRGRDFCHAAEGAKVARKILEAFDLERNDIERIVSAVRMHRKKDELTPETIEAKILYDADKIDSLGAVGWGRIFFFAANASAGVLYTGREKEVAKLEKDYSYTPEDTAFYEYERELKKLPGKLFTKEGRRIARERLDFMKEYDNRFWQEVKGKK